MKCCFLSLGAILLLPATSAAAGKPDILVIVSDDQGCADTGFQGKDIPTPQLDRLAREGLRCTSGYVSHMSPRPTPAQLAWQEAELGAMFHLDPRIYNPSRGYQSLQAARGQPPADTDAYAEKFNPAKLDTDQWLATAKAMGAKFAILVVKHETGFCLWRSDANPFSVKHVPWRGGSADILRDFAASCRKIGIKPGVFTEARWDLRLGVRDFKVSPKSSVTQAQYNRLVEQEVDELCSRYGPLFEIWFDGGVRAPADGGPDVLPIVAKHQPAILFYHSDQRRDVRWGGTESGAVSYPCWATVDLGRIKTGTNPRDYLAQGDADGGDWCPAMSDSPLRCAAGRHDWFWEPGGERGVAPLARLQKMYYESVGRNSTLVIGLTPDRDGLLPPADASRCREFGTWLGDTFGAKPLAETSGKDRELTLEIQATVTLPVTHIILQEDIGNGERVREFVVEARLAGEWKQIAAGTCIGHKRIVRIQPCDARRFRLRITKSAGDPKIRSFSLRGELTHDRARSGDRP
jgi:alpha-L-fucosidase